MFYTNDFTSIGMVGYSLYGAWQQDDVSVLGKYDRMHNDVIVRCACTVYLSCWCLIAMNDASYCRCAMCAGTGAR